MQYTNIWLTHKCLSWILVFKPYILTATDTKLSVVSSKASKKQNSNAFKKPCLMFFPLCNLNFYPCNVISLLQILNRDHLLTTLLSFVLCQTISSDHYPSSPTLKTSHVTFVCCGAECTAMDSLFISASLNTYSFGSFCIQLLILGSPIFIAWF